MLIDGTTRHEQQVGPIATQELDGSRVPGRAHATRPRATHANARMAAYTPDAHPAVVRSVLDDAGRLAAVQFAARIDASGQRVLNSLTALAASVMGAALAAVTLVDQDRQILLSVAGFRCWWASVGETPLEYSLCRHVVAKGMPLAITDTSGHPLARGNPLVTELNVRAYAGAPLWTRDGHCLGAFAVLTTEIRDWSLDELAILDELAVAAALEITRVVDGFTGRTAAASVTPHVAADDVPLLPAPLNPRPVIRSTNLMLRVWRELHHRRVVRVGLAYLAVAWLIIDVASEVLPPLGLPDSTQTMIVIAAALGLPLVLATAWAFDITPAGIMRADGGAASVAEEPQRSTGGE